MRKFFPTSVDPSGGASTAAGARTHQLLGDVATMDPCSLVDTAMLKAYEPLRTGVGVSYEECLSVGEAITVRVMTGTSVTEEQLAEASQHVSWEQRGEVKVDRQGSEGTCTSVAIFPDRLMARTAISAETVDQATLCDLSDKILYHAVDVISEGQVGHQQIPETSLVRADPCTVLSPADISAVPGVQADAGSPVGAHRCEWGSSADNRVVVWYRPDLEELDEDATVRTVANRASTVVYRPAEDGSTASCEVETTVGQTGERFDKASVTVNGAGDGDQLCHQAQSLAEVVWPKLPS